MGILNRIVSMTKAVTNEVLDKLESPTLLMNQYLRDLDEQLAHAEQTVVEQQAQERIYQAKLDDCNKQMAYFDEKAEQAALEGREFDARTAIEAKLLYQDNFEDLLHAQQLTSQAITEWLQRIELMKEERSQLQAKRDELMARMQKVNASNGFPANAGVYGGLHGSSAAQGFNRIEQKIMEWEARQEVSQVGVGYGIASSHRAANSYGRYASTTGSKDEQQAERTAHVEAEFQKLLEKQTTKNATE